MNHLLEKKPTKRTRRLKRESVVAPADAAKIRKLLGQ
jgi:large subunit ribosomal protein L35